MVETRSQKRNAEAAGMHAADDGKGSNDGNGREDGDGSHLAHEICRLKGEVSRLTEQLRAVEADARIQRELDRNHIADLERLPLRKPGEYQLGILILRRMRQLKKELNHVKERLANAEAASANVDADFTPELHAKLQEFVMNDSDDNNLEYNDLPEMIEAFMAL